MKPISLALAPAAAALLAAAPAHAAIWTFGDPTTFHGAVSSATTDPYFDLNPGAQAPGSLERTLGGYSYVIGGVQQPRLWAVAYPPEGNGLQPYMLNDSLRVSGLTGGATALSAYFFASSTDGLPEPGALTLTIRDGTDTLTQTLSLAGPTFLGFISTTGAITELTVSGNALPTLTQLTLAVPEPDQWALMVAGLGLVGGLLRQRRS